MIPQHPLVPLPMAEGDECGGMDWGFMCVDPVGSITDAAANSILDTVAESVGEWLEQTFSWITGWWANQNFIELGSDGPGQVTDWLNPLAVYFAILGVILAGIKMIWDNKNGAGHAQDLVRDLITMVLGTTALVPTVNLLGHAADELASWLLDLATDGQTFEDLLKSIGDAQGGQLALIGFIIMGIVLALMSIAVGATLMFRSAALLVITAFIPLAFALVTTQAGKQWMQKIVSWMAALVAFKPVVAVILAVGFLALKVVPEEGSTALIMAVCIFALATLSLPTLIRLVTPAVGAVAGGMSGGAIAGMAGGAVASGAAGVMTMRTLSGGGAGGSTSSQAAGSSGGSSEGAAKGAGSAGAAAGAAAGPVGAGVAAAGSAASKGVQAAGQAGSTAIGGGDSSESPGGASGAAPASDSPSGGTSGHSGGTGKHGGGADQSGGPSGSEAPRD